MTQAIFYKEWIKTRWWLLALFTIFAAFTFYTLLNLSKIVEFRGAEVVWSALIFKDTVLVEPLRYLPLLAGGLLAAVQFVPEVVRKRLKLTLHLPYPQGKMIGMMYGYGMAVLLLVFAVQLGGLCVFLRSYLVRELVARIAMTMLVWYLAGVAAYLWVAAFCIEPAWKMRAVLLLLLSGLVRLLFLSSVPEGYNGFLPWLALYVLCAEALIFHSVIRFKEGVQD